MNKTKMLYEKVKEYPILIQWVENECSATRLSQNTVRDETLKHPSVANIKFNLVKAIEAFYKSNRKYLDGIFIDKKKGRYYKCFDLIAYGKYAPIVAYVAKRHYSYRIYKYRFGIHTNSLEGARLFFDKPMAFIRQDLLTQKTTMPFVFSEDAFFDDVSNLAYRISNYHKELLVKGNMVYGLKSLDVLCNLCLFNLDYLSEHKEGVYHFFSKISHKGYRELYREDVIENLKKKTCLACLHNQDALINIIK